MKDLIDDNELEEDESDNDSDIGKRKRDEEEDDEFDDRLEDEDYDLIEENLGVKVQRVRRTNCQVLLRVCFILHEGEYYKHLFGLEKISSRATT